MTTCWACETQLDPAWRFCIHCGVPVERDASPSSRDRPPLPVLAVFSIILGGIGVLVIVIAVLVALLR